MLTDGKVMCWGKTTKDSYGTTATMPVTSPCSCPGYRSPLLLLLLLLLFLLLCYARRISM
tara:strand:- start:407 stop:586 length:180 start_codon:yes stop_codon:yes gene_type:complete